MAEVSDAQLFKMARLLAKHDGDIERIFAGLKRERQAQQKTAREVKVVKAAAQPSIGSGNGLIKGSKQGLALGGAVKLGRGGFSISGPALRAANGAFMVFGAAHAATAISKQVRDFSRVQEQHGTQEAVTRVATSVPRNIARLFFDAAAETFGEILGASEATITDVKIRLRRAIRQAPLFGDTAAQAVERRALEKAAAEDADRKASAFVDEQFMKPIKANALQASAFVRTSREAAAIMKRLDENNAGAVTRARKTVFEHSMRENLDALR